MGRWKPEDRTPLALLRFNAGYTREQAAVNMKMGLITLAKYESGMNDIPFGIGEQMAKLYGVSFEDIRQAVLATKKAAHIQTEGRPIKLDNTPIKIKPLKDREIMNMALKNADNLKEAAI